MQEFSADHSSFSFFHAAYDFVGLYHTLPTFLIWKVSKYLFKIAKLLKILIYREGFFHDFALTSFFFILSPFSSWEKNFYTGTKLSISLNIFPSAFFFCVLFSSVFYKNALFAFMKALYFWAGFLKRPEAVTPWSFSDRQKLI